MSSFIPVTKSAKYTSRTGIVAFSVPGVLLHSVNSPGRVSLGVERNERGLLLVQFPQDIHLELPVLVCLIFLVSSFDSGIWMLAEVGIDTVSVLCQH